MDALKTPGRQARGRVWIALLLALPLAACSKSDSESSKPPTDDSPAAHSHAADGDSCFICDPAKRESGRLWCREHACYEDRCWLCHPELEDKNRPYCREHSLYEDECTLCHPELGGDSPPASAGEERGHAGHGPGSSLDEMYCRDHRLPERECGICQPQLARELQPGEDLKIRFQSPSAAAKAGVRTAKPQPGESRPGFAAFCEVRYNENKLARITPLARGLVRRVLADVGAEVEAGETLVEIHSAEIATAKAAFVSAGVDFRLKENACEREKRLVEKKIAAEREFQEAEAACKTAELAAQTTRQTLLNYGLTETEIAAVETNRDSSALLQVRAPFHGTLVARGAVPGEAAQPGTALFTLADLSDVWLELSVSGDRMAVIEKDLHVEATFANLPGFVANGSVTWINPSLDERSRMVKARAVVPNPEGKLRAGMFGEARVLLRDTAPSLRLPKSALQRLETRPYVFVALADDLYALRRVLLGSGTDRSIDVLQGIGPDESVVIDGTFTVMSEFLKSRLGAGCVDE